MQITEVQTSAQLREFMTEPSEGLQELMRRLTGTVLVLGAGGKMGPELIETMVRAGREASGSPRLVAASRYRGDQGERLQERFRSHGVEVLAGDLTDEAFRTALPEAELVIFMAGFKFGSSDDPERAVQMNCVLPGQVAMQYPRSKVVVFSSGNPYPLTRPESGGSRETDALAPQGLYGWSVVGREMAFRVSASGHDCQQVCFYRLAYAQHLTYGVLVDLAQMIRDGREISLATPYVNLVSQRDAIDRALLGFEVCSNPPLVMNVAGPATSVRHIVERLAEHMGRRPRLLGDEEELALLANDELCVRRFGPYRDAVEDMIEAVAKWVQRGGETWNKPTLFGQAEHQY